MHHVEDTKTGIPSQPPVPTCQLEYFHLLRQLVITWRHARDKDQGTENLLQTVILPSALAGQVKSPQFGAH